MKSLATLLLSFAVILSGWSQDVHISFTATGAATTIDSVTALNHRSGEAVTFPGDATLVLKRATGVSEMTKPSDRLAVYPNPFPGESSIRISIGESQKVSLRVLNIMGQVVARSDEFLQAGTHEFVFSISVEGIYTVTLGFGAGLSSCKVVCLSSFAGENRIRYTGLGAEWESLAAGREFKSLQSGYSLDYLEGDIIHYTGYSGTMATVMTEIPTVSKSHELEFAVCTDPDGKNYKIVKIGEQIWMEENLAYLPEVSPSSAGSDTLPYYYVYGYEGTSVSAAKSQANYAVYGVLYNWEAAISACPAGWHLPSDEEWTILMDYLTNNGYGYEGSGIDIAKSMASTSGWENSSIIGYVGNNQSTNNSSGFNAVPGGDRSYGGGFDDLGDIAFFWSFTEYGSTYAWVRGLYYVGVRVYRNYHNRRFGFSVRCLRN